MLITAWTLLAFYLVAAAFIVGGYAAKNEGILAFGAAMLILAGWIVMTDGISEKTGEEESLIFAYNISNPAAGAVPLNESVSRVYQYEKNRGLLTNSLGALSFLMGGLMFFYIYDLRKKERERYERGE